MKEELEKYKEQFYDSALFIEMKWTNSQKENKSLKEK